MTTLTVSNVQIGLRALVSLAPDKAWAIAANGTVDWQDATAPPTQAEIDAAVAAAAVPTADHVRAEAQRRILVLTGTTSLEACMIKQLNANMRANELNDIRITEDRAHTAEEAAEAAALRGLADAIKAIRAASNVLEATSPIPADYADDSHWP